MYCLTARASDCPRLLQLGTIVFAVLLVWSIFALQKYQSHVLWANVQGRVTGADEKEQKHRESCHTNWTKAKISDTVASSIFAIASGLLTGYGDTVNRPDPLVSRMLSIIGVTYGIFSVILAAVSGLG